MNNNNTSGRAIVMRWVVFCCVLSCFIVMVDAMRSREYVLCIDFVLYFTVCFFLACSLTTPPYSSRDFFALLVMMSIKIFCEEDFSFFTCFVRALTC